MKILSGLIFAAVTGGHLQAAVALREVYRDGMVLQRDVPVTIAGWADVGEKVVCRQGDRILAEAVGRGHDQEQYWQMRLPALRAGLVGDLSFSGSNTIVLKDLLAGEVWLCAGQSNMDMALRDSYGGVLDAAAEVAAADDPQLRYNRDWKESWQACSPATASNFPAVAYYFGRALRAQLHVPVGLVIRAHSGSAAEYWIPEAAVAKSAGYQEYVAQAKAELTRIAPPIEAYKKQHDAWRMAADAAKAAGTQPPPEAACPLSNEQFWRYEELQAVVTSDRWCFRGISHLVPMTMRGTIWYQGESNARRADQYAEVMSMLISGWRTQWGADFPFLMVQLPNLGRPDVRDGSSSFTLLREAQEQVAHTMTKVGLVPTIDVGEKDNIHPKNKRPVGERLAQVAFRTVYGKDVLATGPRLEHATFAKGKALISFRADSGPLILRAPNGFQLASQDHVWHPGNATVVGMTVEVVSAQVPQPVAVRYAFLNDPEVTLFNAAGWPAFPFRTDDWKETFAPK